MKNSILFVLALGLGLYAYFGVFKKEQAKTTTEAAEKKFAPWEVDEIAHFHIVRGDDELKLVQKNDVWFIQAPVEDRADKEAVRSWVNGFLQSQRASTVYRNESFDPKMFGLETPEAKITLENSKGEGREYWSGSVKAVNGDTYVWEKKENILFTVTSTWGSNLTKNPFDLRDKRLWRTEEPLASRIEMRGSDQNWTLEKTDKGWVSLEQPELKIDTALVGRYLANLQNVRASNYEQIAEEASLKNFGLRPANFSVKIKDKVGEKTFEFGRTGKKGEDATYAKSSEIKDVVKIFPSSFNSVNQRIGFFVDRKPAFGFDPTQAKEINITLNNSVNIKNENGEWVRTSDKAKLDKEKAENMVKAFQAIDVQEVLFDQKAGDLKNKIELKKADGSRLFELAWGQKFKSSANQDLYLLRTNLSDLTMSVAADQMDQLVPNLEKKSAATAEPLKGLQPGEGARKEKEISQ